MSVAFVKERDGDVAPVEELPDRAVSTHPNFVTSEGFAAIELALARHQADWSEAHAVGDRAALARLGREVRYWTSRRATAQGAPPPENPGRVSFGSTVEIGREDGRRQTWRIVGEDEADPAHGALSFVSPLAQALLGREKGEAVEFSGSEIAILGVT